MQPINFFDDGIELPKEREDVRLKQLGLFVHEDGRRIAVGFNLTPFRERPSLDVTLRNDRGEEAGSLTVIEALSPNFNLTMHLRDREPTSIYSVEAIVYYLLRDGNKRKRQIVDRKEATIDVSTPGEQVIN